MNTKHNALGMRAQTTAAEYAPVLTHGDVIRGGEILSRYRAGKARLDARLTDEALWWRSRYGAAAGDTKKGARPVSAWLWNSVCNKHADLCDARPKCTVLPRERGDEEEAGLLSAILPVITDRCHLEETYSDNAWSKLKHGMAAYGVFWNPALENGLGDIDIRRVDPLNLFWDPAVEDIQDSPHLFIVGLEDTESLMERYPILKDRRGVLREDGMGMPDMGGSFLTGNTEGLGERTAVVDWYYKRLTPTGKTRLHYAKFTGDTLLYASENDPVLAETGWYDHGLYPVVTDICYPEEGTPAGYGLIAVGRNPQGYIDELDGHILEYANTASRVRYWAKRSLGINEREFLDPDRRIIEVEGDIDEEKLRQITLSPMDGMLTDVRRMKIDELKETTGNRDVSQGSSVGGVTAASAIAALQEAGNKGSRDIIAGSYRAYGKVLEQVIELIRQFYDETRVFRITGKDGGVTYLTYSNRGLCDRPVGKGSDGEILFRRPVFDLDVKATRQNPLERAERNALLLELYRAGVFDPANREAAERVLSNLDLEGIAGSFALMPAARGDGGAGV